MKMAGEPKNHDLLAEIEILKNGIPWEKPATQHTLLCPLGRVVGGALRGVGRSEGKGKEAAQE